MRYGAEVDFLQWILIDSAERRWRGERSSLTGWSLPAAGGPVPQKRVWVWL